MFRFCKTSICYTHPMLQDSSHSLLLDPVQLATILNQLEASQRPASRLYARVRLGSFVTLTAKDYSETLELQLVEPGDSNPALNKVSFLSPVGAAILGKRRGAEVVVKTSIGDFEWIITCVRQHRGDF
ncbi:GreA/GreB family elongation factor [Aliidiomarina haloalkalitolerans]|uniref:Transcription elongation factor GreA/GreB C-terminal domain-containing protein n=1 Tax=Aliidiomarina haloalkalitolerans TaxID=859059 RepID=A0A432VYQ5_9GAMM|nr:GreA/GreB family elongation factor [Aliidiomarina haloalkalitolerans]RUO21801.1 hypothetical protein CWE06_02835 [Aliidiomarina haloalkalitolerans]